MMVAISWSRVSNEFPPRLRGRVREGAKSPGTDSRPVPPPYPPPQAGEGNSNSPRLRFGSDSRMA
jgi:hypothetical protein